jgi:hypothetical protein
MRLYNWRAYSSFPSQFSREAMLEYKLGRPDHGYFFIPYVRPISLYWPAMDFCCCFTQGNQSSLAWTELKPSLNSDWAQLKFSLIRALDRAMDSVDTEQISSYAAVYTPQQSTDMQSMDGCMRVYCSAPPANFCWGIVCFLSPEQSTDMQSMDGCMCVYCRALPANWCWGSVCFLSLEQWAVYRYAVHGPVYACTYTVEHHRPISAEEARASSHRIMPVTDT